MIRIALVGDSILNNAAYVPEGQRVEDHLRNFFATADPQGRIEVVQLAEDGALARNLIDGTGWRQEMSHVVISAGGNDILQAMLNGSLGTVPIETIKRAASSVAYYLLQPHVRSAIRLVLAPYAGPFSLKDLELSLDTAIVAGAYAGVLRKVARANGAIFRDLSEVCHEPEDFVHDIEPSNRGGYEIAATIANALGFRRP